MKRQKIKRYRFSVTQNTRRRRAARPLKAVGVVLVCLCLLTGAVFGIYKAIQSKTTGWHGEGLHRYYISPTTGTRAQGLYEINYKLYYFGSNNFLKVGWIEENGYVGYANADGELTQGEAKIDGKYYYFQPETGQLYTGWIMLDGVQYCFDETGHPRTGTYQEDGKVWELDSDGRVKNRLNGWKKTDGVLKYYDNSGAPAQGWTEIDGKDYFFVDGVSQAGWVETDAGTRYLDGNGNQMTGWCVIDGQPYAFGTNGELKQGWDHSHEKSYYFINGVSQSGTFGEGALSSNLNGSGSVQPVGDQAPEDDLAEDAEGEPPEEELLEAQPTQTETTEAGQTAPAAQQPTQSPERSAAEQETALKAPTAPETPAQEQQEVSDPVSETGPMWNAALDDNAVLRDGIRVPQNFELPLEGSTGFAGAAVMLLYERPDGTSTVLRRLAAGDMFYIRQESGAYWQVCLLDGIVGWLENELCMINLPDVLPSIVYENPNAKASIFKICGKDIEGITGQKLYDGLFYNQRLGRDEYLMPINYAMAKKVGAAQKNALKAGDCLKIVETFRPYEVQMLVKDAVYAKARMDKELMTALNKGAWNIGWFIATSLSNHQRGVAMDTTLLRITEQTEHSMAGCPFVQVTGEEYAMPSAMHELSSAAACFTGPVTSNSATAWKRATASASMTDGARRLQGYCTNAGMTPLASEWWHFNDLDAQNKVRMTSGNGKFWLDGCVSWKMFEA